MPRPQPDWCDPLAQWFEELSFALAELRQNSAIGPHDIANIKACLAAMPAYPSVGWSLGQLLGRKGPRLRSLKARQRKYPTEQLPLLTSLPFDADLRPRLRASGHTEQQRASLTRLALGKRQRICAAGYVLLAAAVAFCAAHTGACVERGRAQWIAKQVLSVTIWLYGTPAILLTRTLVEALTDVPLAEASLRNWAKRAR
jgi:hypothetical protein